MTALSIPSVQQELVGLIIEETVWHTMIVHILMG